MVHIAVKKLYTNRLEGDLLMDAPESECWEDLVAQAKEEKKLASGSKKDQGHDMHSGGKGRKEKKEECEESGGGSRREREEKQHRQRQRRGRERGRGEGKPIPSYLHTPPRRYTPPPLIQGHLILTPYTPNTSILTPSSPNSTTRSTLSMIFNDTLTYLHTNPNHMNESHE